jgi:hypothetical protein
MRLTILPGVQHERYAALTVNMSKADTQYVDDALTIEDEYESARVRRAAGGDRGSGLPQAGRGAEALPRPQ